MNQVSYLFSTLKQAGVSKKTSFYVSVSKTVLDILVILYKNGYISGFRRVENQFEVYVKYYRSRPLVMNFKLYSTSGNRCYCSLGDLVKKFRRHDFLIISSRLGIITSEEAFCYRVGGELLVKLN